VWRTVEDLVDLWLGNSGSLKFCFVLSLGNMQQVGKDTDIL